MLTFLFGDVDRELAGVSLALVLVSKLAGAISRLRKHHEFSNPAPSSFQQTRLIFYCRGSAFIAYKQLESLVLDNLSLFI